MRKILFYSLSVVSLTAFSQWTSTSILSSGEDCYSVFGKVLASDATSSALAASTDEGVTWPSSNIGVPASGLSFGATNGGTVYAYRNKSIYQSTTGNNWTAMTTTAIAATEVIKDIAVISTNSVFACTNPISGNGIKIYQLSGSNWAYKASVPTSTAPLSVCMENMNGELWIGTTSTVSIKSTNGGTTWSKANGTYSPSVWWDKYIFCMASNTTSLLMGNYGGLLLRSTNSGASWNTVYNISGTSSIGINDIYVISSNDIIVGCDSGFIYSNNGGISFSKNNLGFTYSAGVLQDQIAKVTASTNYLFAATKNGKIYRRAKTGVFTDVKDISSLNIESKVYPNPSNDFTTIEASDLMFDKNCEVKIRDILGRDISVTEMKNGKANINLNNFAKGIYTYSVYNNNSVVSKGKLVVN